MSQTEAILNHMQKLGPITPIEALRLYGCFRLGARVWDLKRKGYSVRDWWVHLDNGKRVKRYGIFGRKVEDGAPEH